MNILLWIIAGVLAAVFVASGLMKATQPKEKLAASLPWVNDFSLGTIRFIGIAEILGAIGLILPGATGIAAVLTPIAAVCLAVTMVLAAVVHGRRGETQAIVVNVVLLALALFVAVMRFGPNAF
ncbi:DoxX family protein [Gordonia sp. (in: high G+C Gram-positive bacteria)]|jgi:uncharacterized membrane protein YphA (DoxX/SURF4 family)|uniref:DoxX family protein n=1 Tax=Gordonia sp. (in: high G+C Gram-positive bacteria) TaxID=84139 RepID=UPI001DA576AE|nr:DoxX family protein [Gordonia sp. (in: high G+C Gram-positive bacteria)]MCB1293085.1 DoxX family protein [Gordonia sp. (in: high G+C Gram-positive bacteria)]HMS74240.1 DoxX family protein [Gordonia sp. (in: high G+C Gram-positive bacteria)]HQV21454.1 DoxX family protein [Gordonia sp. (in: high G+C Gram-positive bacteria)]